MYYLIQEIFIHPYQWRLISFTVLHVQRAIKNVRMVPNLKQNEFKIQLSVKHLLLTKFEFFSGQFMAQARSVWPRNQGKKLGSVFYITDQENKVNKIFIIISQRCNSNFMDHTVEYGLQNWPITVRVLHI